VRDVAVRFQVLSLSVLNEGREVEAWYREWLDAGWGPARVAKAVEQKYGPAEVRAVYDALGNRIHLEKRALDRSLYVDALTEAGLPTELADAADSTDLDAAMLAGNQAGLGPVGEDLGTPAIHVTMPDGSVTAFFGPVVTPVPRGEAAGRLWDGVLLVAGTDGFYELKRARARSPQVA
jgi:mycothiol-dependent nitroreductase-like protein